MSMPATVKQLTTPDTVAAELWQVAESGEVAELLPLLPRIGNLNVRNRYGMTALMKAAFRGHEPMVRVLLEHGADPNLMRNDRFTALALAAFFGHTETVKTLIEHGAHAEVKTRCGASARTWAAARTFGDLAKSMETQAPAPVKHAPARVLDLPAPVPYTRIPVEPEPAAPMVVHTLKDPPEIWDLVHEAPRNFNRWSAFVSRIATMKRTTALGVVALVVLVCCGLGMLVLRTSRVREPETEIPQFPSAGATVVSEPVRQQPVAETPAVEAVNDNQVSVVPNKGRSPIRQPRISRAPEVPLPTAQSREPQAQAVASPQFESAKTAPPPTKSSPVNPPSPNLIAPAKNTPPKGKVIQWP
jgi:hypothetical protein